MINTRKLLIFVLLPAIILASVLGFYYIKRTGPYYLPDITLETYDGRPVALNSLHGKPVLVVFWASTCSTCIREIPNLIALHDDYSKKGLEMVGIVIYYNNKEDANAMVLDRSIPYRILYDQNKTATHAFRNVHYTPTTFLIAPNGRIVYRQVGDIDFELIRDKTQEWLVPS